MVTASCLWFGSEAAIAGIRPTFWKKYDASLPNDARVDAVMEWLRLPAEKRPHLVTLYFGDVDGAGHRFGPDAPEVEAAVRRVDQALGRLLDGIESLPFANNVLVVLVSDHGMAKVTKELTVPIESLTGVEGLRTYGAGSQMNVWVDGGQARARVVRDEINANIHHGRAYTREEIPASLHYRSDPRIGDVLIIMEEPWRVLPPKGGTRDMTALGGWHGWNPSSSTMHGIFLAMGPGIRRNAEIPSFESIHIYPFLAESLGLEPAAGIDGRKDWLRRSLTNVPAGSASPLAFLNVDVVDVVRGNLQSGQDVLISDGRITATGPAGTINVPSDAVRVPAKGRYLIPGLWDMHVHLRSAAAPRTGQVTGAPLEEANAAMLGVFLPHGIVGIREMGGDLADLVLRWREEIRNGQREGPRILTAGRKLDGVPSTWPGSLAVTTPREARDAVRQMKAAGVDFIKVSINEARLDVLAAATDEAHRLGLRALGHWAANLAIQRVVEVGQDGVEHALLLAAYRPNFFAQFQRELAARKATTLLAMDRVEIMARQFHMEDRTESERLYRRMAARGVWFTPTLAIERQLGLELGTRDFSSDPRQKYISPAIWDSWNPQSGARRPVEPRRRELFAERVRRSEQATLAAYRAGVPMLAGSDCGANNSYMFCGWSLHEELEALVRAGLTPAEALRMSTINAARWRGAAGSEGTVERGKVADLVLLRANPLSDIRHTREVEAVVRSGRYHLRNDLDAMLRKVQESAAAARQQRLQ